MPNSNAQQSSLKGFSGGSSSPGMRLFTSGFNVNSLRTNTILSKDEWKFFDDAIVNPARDRLRAVGGLIERGLSTNLPNALGKTIFEWEDIDDFGAADETMDGINQSEHDRANFTLKGVPIYITHKKFHLNLRHLEASRERGEPLDTTYAEQSSRSVAEKIENAYFNGASPAAGGYTVPGLTTQTNRIQATHGAGGYSADAWQLAAASTTDIRSDVLQMKQDMLNKGFFGPYILYVASDAETKLDQIYDSTGNVGETLRDSIMRISGIVDVQTSDFLPSGEQVMVQATSDVVRIIDGQQPTMVEWEVEGGWRMNFQIFSIMVPNIRDKIASDGVRTAGVVHLTA